MKFFLNIKKIFYSPIFIGTLVLFLFLIFFYHKAIFSPNKFLIDSYGDGIKNYFTYAYLIKNDNSFINTHSVNYPYGENFAYLDCQPLVAFSVKTLSLIFPFFKDYSIGLMHLFIILSVIIAFIFLFLIFKEYNVNKWLSVFASVLIITLSPQFYRIGGHYSLSYMWIIPATWYLVLKFFKKPSLKTYILIFINILFSFFLHTYLGLIAFSLFVTGSFLHTLFYAKDIKKIEFLKAVAVAIIPVIIFYFVVNVTDTHTDRTKSPVGLFVYHSNLKSIFLPTEESHKIFYNWLIDVPKKDEYDFEGYAYVGLFVNVSIIITLLLLLIFLIKRKISAITNVYKKDILILLIICIIFLIIALEKPIEGFIVWVVNYLPPLKQFRVLGRFAWVFYYLINIAMVIIIYRWYKNFKIKFSILLFLPLIFIPIESYLFHRNFHRFVLQQPNVFNEKYLDNETKEILTYLKNQNFQAIIPLPFFHYGSDDFIKEPEEQNTRYYSLLVSYYLNKSLVACNTGRTSVEETCRIFQILLPEFYDKPFKNEVKKEPFLIIHYKGEKLNKREEEILNLSDKIIETDNLLIKKISYENLFKYSLEKTINEYISVNDSSFYKNGFFVTDTTSSVYYNGFEEYTSKIYHSGNSSLVGNKSFYNHLAEFKAGSLKDNEEYCASFWYYNKGNSRTHNMFVVEETDENGQVNWIYVVDPRFSTIVDGYWSLVEMYFKVKNNKSVYKIFSVPTKTWQDTFYVDDLLVRPINVNVFKVLKNKNNSILFYNNHFININIHYAILDSRNKTIINYFTNQILNNKEWYEKIKNEAKSKNIPLKEWIRKNAEFMLKETFLKSYDIEDIKIQYFVEKIKSDKNWLKHILNKPENKGKNLDQLLIDNAKYMLNN